MCSRRRGLIDHRHHGENDHHGSGNHQRPRNRLPSTEFPGQKPAFGVPDGRPQHSGEQQEVRPVNLPRAAAVKHRERHRGYRPGRGDEPEEHPHALLTAQDSHHSGCGGQQCNHHSGVAGRRRGQGIGRQDRKCEDNAHCDDHQSHTLTPGRASLSGQCQRCAGQYRGDHGTRRTDEQWRQSLDGDAGEDHGEGEAENTEQPPP